MGSLWVLEHMLILRSEIHSHRAALRNLGYQVAEKSYAFPGDEVASAEQSHSRHQETIKPNFGSLRDAEGSSAKKRKYEAARQYEPADAQVVRGSSRDLMPPPLPRSNHPKRSHHSQVDDAYRNPPYRAPRRSGDDDRRPQPAQLGFRQPPAQSHSVPLEHPVHQWQEFNGAEPNQHQYLTVPGAHDHSYTPVQPTPYQNNAATSNRHTQPRPHDSIRSLRHLHDSQISSYGESYGTAAQQTEVHRDVRPLPTGSIAQDQVRALPAQGYVPPEQPVPAVRTAAMQSPFFRNGPARARPDSLQTLAHESQDLSRPPKQPLFQAQAQRQPSHATERRPAPDQSAYQPPLRYSQYHHPPPQTPLGPIHRPDRPPSVFSYAPSRISPQTPRGRVSLPPNSVRAPTYVHGNQDGALSQIQGIRGLASRQSKPSAFATQPAYGVSRELFSAAGSRRSVRR